MGNRTTSVQRTQRQRPNVPRIGDTIDELAASLGFTGKHLRNIIARGEGPKLTPFGARQIILHADRDAWLASRPKGGLREKPKGGRVPRRAGGQS